MRYEPRKLDYYTVTVGVIGTQPPIANGAILSRDEFIRRGLDPDWFLVLTGGTLSPVDSSSVQTYKDLVNLSRDTDQGLQRALVIQADSWEAAIASSNDTPSEYAKLFKEGMEKWQLQRRRYDEAKTIPLGGSEPRPWANAVSVGFQMDHLRAEFDIIEKALIRLLEPLKPAIAKLPGFTAINLQNFVGRLNVYLKGNAIELANEVYTPAYNDIEMLIHKLIDFELGEKRMAQLAEEQKQKELSDAERERTEEARKKGIAGIRHYVNQKYPEKTAEWIIGGSLLGIGIILGLIIAGVGALVIWLIYRQ